jgi:hypothetical protein
VLVDVIPNENNAVNSVSILSHVPFDFSTRINQASKHHRVNGINPLGAPTFIKVVEHDPHASLVLKVRRHLPAQR